MSKPLVIYHGNCTDGFCAAWVAHRAILGGIEALPVEYGPARENPPDVTCRDVLILDFSYPREVLQTMYDQSASMTVLDHHKTAQADLEGLDFCKFDMEKSGARLTWEWFNPKYAPVPWVVQYVEDRDLWRHKLPNSRAINAYIRSFPMDFEVWDNMFSAIEHQGWIVNEGEAIVRSEKQIIDQHVKRAHVQPFMGEYPVPIVNATCLWSDIANALCQGKPLAATYFDRPEAKVRQWSLRSDENGVDVSELAKRKGGGGHKHAAGFEERL